MASNTLEDPVVIVGYARTPLGALCGALAGFPAPKLGAAALAAARQRAGVSAEEIDEILMGCVLPAGQGQAPARQAALAAEFPASAGATTINKMCGSGMKAIMLGHDLIRAGSARVVMAGGMESMTNAPHLVESTRAGIRLGDRRLVDHMVRDGLEDAYDVGRLMGAYADDCAAERGLSRERLDDWAVFSFERARAATAKGAFADEIVPLPPARPDNPLIARDEPPFKSDLDRIRLLKPAFTPDGAVTAGNASAIADGAAALMLMRLSHAKDRGLKPIAQIRAHATYADRPARFPTAPIGAIATVLEKAGWSMREVDLFEINEAFAVVALAAMDELGLEPDRVNIHGGACALGHPLGATGARIVVTLVAALRRLGLGKGVASLCIGGGEATAVAVECL